MRRVNPLIDTQIRSAKPRAKMYRLADGEGLYLEVRPNGAKYWRYCYRYQGKEQMLSLGVYPDTPLASRKDKNTGETIKGAREKLADARALLASGVNPSAHRQATKAAKAEACGNTFEVVAREWLNKKKADWAESTATAVRRRLEMHLFPWLGRKPVSEITAAQLLEALRRVEALGALETAHRELNYCGQIFRYAIVTHRASRDPSADLRGALTPAKGEHLAAITDPKRLPDFLKALYAYEGTLTVKCALRLAPLVFVRPGELRTAKWADIDFDAREWRYEIGKTKKSGVSQHIVPLSRQSVAILRELQPLTGKGEYVFPGARSPGRPMSENAVLAALRYMDIPREEMSGHGFRAMARTLLDEVLNVSPHLIEHQLAHTVRDPLGRAYNRTKHLPERHKMMQRWANYLDGLRTGDNVIPLMRKA